ncbi:hypothetical protein J6590_053158 [Homalodisca vitripennis]|nr:hypothetical protein J6590_053158 [Homalodisca vitripennis]
MKIKTFGASRTPPTLVTPLTIMMDLNNGVKLVAIHNQWRARAPDPVNLHVLCQPRWALATVFLAEPCTRDSEATVAVLPVLGEVVLVQSLCQGSVWRLPALYATTTCHGEEGATAPPVAQTAAGTCSELLVFASRENRWPLRRPSRLAQTFPTSVSHDAETGGSSSRANERLGATERFVAVGARAKQRQGGAMRLFDDLISLLMTGPGHAGHYNSRPRITCITPHAETIR